MGRLAQQYKRSGRWVRTELDKVVISNGQIAPQSVVIVADTMFLKRTLGVCVMRSAHLGKNLCWRVATKETTDVYQQCRSELEGRGFEITAAVIDGKRGLIEVFWDIPIQMCHFHQIAIITRYITTRPKLPAGQALRDLTLTLPRTQQHQFHTHLQSWYTKWESFLKEKTLNPETKRWFYTHKRLRSAYRSLSTNFPFLFTYQRYPELNIPNTTNSLDGTFAHVKDLLRIHRGLKKQRKLKLIHEILSK